VNHAGVPKELPGSPFATGGRGTTGPATQFNSPQITTARHFLYAANDFDSNIAAFEIESRICRCLRDQCESRCTVNEQAKREHVAFHLEICSPVGSNLKRAGQDLCEGRYGEIS
jgi:hypothetical protein